jgi:Flp pilus assembly protein TadB
MPAPVKNNADGRRRAYAKSQEAARQRAQRDAARSAGAPSGTRRPELRLLSYLFLVSALTMLLVMMYFAASVLKVTVPYGVGYAWVVVIGAGIGASWVLGMYTAARLKRWWWFVVIAVPPAAVPAALAFAWNRRMEIEDETLSDRS